MTPLIDVTNTVIDEVPGKINHPCSGGGTTDEGTAGTKLKSSKFTVDKPTQQQHKGVRKVKQKHRKRNFVEVKPPTTSEEPQNSPASTSSRVPPIPSAAELLTTAVEKLQLSQRTTRTSPNTEEEHTIQATTSSVPPSDTSGLLALSSSPLQCVSCKMECSSVDILTAHLLKHIMEGLHAANWLSNAMNLLLPTAVEGATTDPQTSPNDKR